MMIILSEKYSYELSDEQLGSVLRNSSEEKVDERE